jgi:hypothetical protein
MHTKRRIREGADVPADLDSDKEFVKKAYTACVPMGQDLPKAEGKAPSFVVWAMKDPESDNLDRVQMIKVWANPANGLPMEKIYDVAWSGDRKPDPSSGKLAAVGNTDCGFARFALKEGGKSRGQGQATRR